MAASKKDIKEAYLKFLRCVNNEDTRAEAIRTAPDDVIKAICNAAYNTQYNRRVRVKPKDQKILKEHLREISILTSKRPSLKKKRQLLQTGGVLPFIPVLLGSALATLGAHLFSR